MKISKQSLSAALEAAWCGNKPTSLPVLSCVKIENGTLTASDLNQFGQRKIDADGEMPAVCVSANALRSSLAFFGGELELSLDGGKVLIKSGESSRCELLTVDASEFPEWPDKFTNIGISASDLADAIEAVSFAGDNNEVMTERNGVHVKTTPKSMIAEAHKGVQFARCEKHLIGVDAEFFIPLAFTKAVCENLRQPEATVSISDSYVQVTHANGKYCCKLYNTRFVNADQFVKSPRKKLGEIRPDKWLPLVRGAISMSGEDSRLSCCLNIANGKLFNRSKSGNIDVPIPEKLAECELRVNAMTFEASLRAVGPKATISTGLNDAIVLESGDLVVIEAQLHKSST